jgi:hypothetical protein
MGLAFPSDQVLEFVTTMLNLFAPLKMMPVESTVSCFERAEWWVSAYGPSKHCMRSTQSGTNCDPAKGFANAQSLLKSTVPGPHPLRMMMGVRPRQALPP